MSDIKHVSADLKIHVTGDFFDPDTTEENLRYAVEQCLEDSFDDVDVRVYKDINVFGKWISVKDRQPVETNSIFYRFYGTKRWSNAMWREQSEKVLVTVAFKDGTKTVTTGETHDGVWNTTISRTLEPVVTHWMPLPEPPKEESND